jgi:hypothetical protein
MKPLWIALPILALVVFVLVRALLRRPVARHTLNVVVALYLLGYLLATATLGLFWVARMDLPAFDLHYLFGYCLLVLTAWHLWFQAPILAAFFRRISPAALLEADRRRFRPAVRVTLLSLWALEKTPAVLNFSTGPATMLDCVRLAGLKQVITSRANTASAARSPTLRPQRCVGNYLETLAPKAFGVKVRAVAFVSKNGRRAVPLKRGVPALHKTLVNLRNS